MRRRHSTNKAQTGTNSRATLPPFHSADSSLPPPSQTCGVWKLSTGDRVMVPPQNRFLSLSKDIRDPTTEDEAMRTHDFMVAVDPGVKNTGVAIFTKNPDGSINLVTTIQFVYDKGTVYTALSDIFNVCARVCADLSAYADTKDKPNRVLFVVENQFKDNTALGHFFPMLQALLYWSRPYAAPFEYRCIRIAPETVRKVHGLPRASSWIDRKKMALGYAVNGTRRIITRHDTADAINLGIAAMIKKNCMRGTRLINLEHYFAPSDPEPKPEDEMHQHDPFDVVHRDSAYSSSSSSSSSSDLPPISSLEQPETIIDISEEVNEDDLEDEKDDDESYEEESLPTTPETVVPLKSPSDDEDTKELFEDLDNQVKKLQFKMENPEECHSEEETSDVSAELSCSDDRNGELNSNLDSSKAFGPLSHSRKYDKFLEKQWQAAAEKP